MREREILENFILSKRAGKTHYLRRETAAYIGSGGEVKGNNIEDKRNK